METLIINYHGREKRFAILEQQKLQKIVIDRPEHRSLVGNLYYGTVTKVLPGMNAVFIDIGEEKNAYLHRDRLPSFVRLPEKERNVTSYVHQGEKLLVQVEKDAGETKGPRVTGIIEIQGNHLIYMPQGRYVAVSKKIADEQKKAMLRQLGKTMKTDEEGLIFRTSSISSTAEELQQELSVLRGRYEEIVQQTAAIKKPGIVYQNDTFIEMAASKAANMKNGEVIVDDLPLKKLLEEIIQVPVTYYNGKENIFAAHHLEHELEKALKRIVWLDNGAYLVFDETEALTVIDVNTGKFSGKTNYQDTVLKTNQLAAKEVIRQLRLREIGGIILIDFIDMNREEDKQSILRLVEKEITKDEKQTKIIGFTPLGILQLTRKKTKAALSETMKVKCPVCDGTGRILSSETVAFRLERELLEHRHSEFEAVLIETTNEVKKALAGQDGEYQRVLEELLGLKIYFLLQPAVQPYYVLKQFGKEADLSDKSR